jgi:hypothetical protein
LELYVEDGQLHFYAAETGQKLLTHREAEQARLQAEQARLQAEHGRLQAEQSHVQAEQARLLAEQARLQAEDRASREAVLRRAAEARVAELEAQLRAFQTRRSPEEA